MDIYCKAWQDGSMNLFQEQSYENYEISVLISVYYTPDRSSGRSIQLDHVAKAPLREVVLISKGSKRTQLLYQMFRLWETLLVTMVVVLVTSARSTSVIATTWGKVINRRDTNPNTVVKDLVPGQEDTSQK